MRYRVVAYRVTGFREVVSIYPASVNRAKNIVI